MLNAFGGQFTSSFGGDETADCGILQTKLGEQIKQKYIDRDEMFDDFADNIWAFSYENNMWYHPEEIVLYDPRNPKHIEGSSKYRMEANMTSINEHTTQQMFSILEPPVRKLFSDVSYNYGEWQQKIKRAFDENDVAESTTYSDMVDLESAE